MSIELITLIFFGFMLLLLATGLPIVFALGGLSLGLAFFLWGPEALGMSLYGAVSIVKYSLLVCVPLFVFMGMMMYHSGIADDLYNAFQYWLAPIPGSLASATVGVCTIFAAIVSSEATATLTMGSIALPLMRKRGYSKYIATGCIQAGAALGFLIPPSAIAILYAVIAKESVGMLFAGGLFPGLLLATLFIIYITVRCKIQPHLAPPIPKEERPDMREKLRSLRGLVLPMSIIILVMGSIIGGLTTPVEASAVGALASIIAVAIKRRLSLRVIQDSLMASLKLTGIMMWIFMGALTFGKIYDGLGAKDIVEAVMTGLPLGRWGILIMIQLTFFILGTCLDDTAILFITMPIYIPIIKELGFDPVWFGVLYLVNMQMAYLTPPFGYCLMLMRGVVPPDITMGDIYRSVIPFVLLQGVGLAIIMLFPQVVLWLPHLIFGS
ncbi:MAG: TRAP transporter large permease subunit [Dehalococcoidia bacterium]|nr:MAG: TRAP transporter large permease subunit [Dehalococcoidia bacterium]